MKKTIGLIFLGLFCTLGFVLFLGVIYVSFTKPINSESSSNEGISASVNSYKRLEFNPSNNEISRNVITMNENLGPDEYIYYQNQNGVHVLMSNFETNQYICTGSCVCEEEGNYLAERRSSHSTVLGRGLIYLVASLSSVVAIDKAKVYFDQDCKQRFSDTCEPHFVKSTVEDCSDEKSEPPSHSSQPEKKSEKKEEILTRVCFGNCLTNRNLDKQLLQDATHNKCYVWELSGQSSVPVVDYDLSDTEQYNEVMRIVYLAFQEHQLHPYCLKNSVKVIGGGDSVHLCSGRPSKGPINPSIVCFD